MKSLKIGEILAFFEVMKAKGYEISINAKGEICGARIKNAKIKRLVKREI
ncbi:MAG: hypothetical protein ACTTJC_02005 [Campylobacter sp.]